MYFLVVIDASLAMHVVVDVLVRTRLAAGATCTIVTDRPVTVHAVDLLVGSDLQITIHAPWPWLALTNRRKDVATTVKRCLSMRSLAVLAEPDHVGIASKTHGFYDQRMVRVVWANEGRLTWGPFGNHPGNLQA